MPEIDITALDATAQAALVESGEATAAELVEAAISRAEEVNPQINAIILPLYEEAREAASEDLPSGPFKGVPFLFKDLGTVLQGQPLHSGNRVLKEIDFRAPFDSSLGAKFRDAGLVTIGKTNTPEFGILPTTEPVAYGPTRNPWDLGRSAGGSSGGSGAAVAAGIVPVAHASDGGGSIRIPASANGLVGLKPSRARISLSPYSGDSMSGLTTEFILAHSIRDVATMLDWVHGAEPGDPYAALPPARPYSEEISFEPESLTIALLTESLTGDELNPEVVQAAHRTALDLEALGHTIVEPEIPVLGNSEDLYQTFITRWAAGMAETATTLGFIIGRDLTASDVEPLSWSLIERGRSQSGADYLFAVRQHQAMARVIAAFYEGGIDLIMTPTLADIPPPLGTYDDSGPDPMSAMQFARRIATFTGAFNATGQPAISLPLQESSEGLPIGIQLVAPIWREDLLIQLSAQLERAHPWAGRRPSAFVAG
ncbi:MAG: amidase [Solirubrobacterales bacterium]